MMRKYRQILFLRTIVTKTVRPTRNHFHRFVIITQPNFLSLNNTTRRSRDLCSSSIEQGLRTPNTPLETEQQPNFLGHPEKDVDRLSADRKELSADNISGTDLVHVDDIMFDEALVTPVLPQSSSLAAFVEHSQTLQQLLKLGVNLHKLDQRPDVANFLAKLDFDRDIKKKILFLTEFGIGLSDIGVIITKNPYLLSEEDHNLKVRTKYLASKKFTPDNISDVIRRCPGILSLSVKDIDQRLGMLQKSFHYTGDEIRSVIIGHPQLAIFSEKELRYNITYFKEQLMFEGKHLKSMVKEFPKLLTIGASNVTVTFHYLIDTLGIKRNLIVKQPRVLNTSKLRLRQRHQFLQHMGKAQYDPTLPAYVPLSAIAVGSDVDFCENTLDCTVQKYNDFLKTL